LKPFPVDPDGATSRGEDDPQFVVTPCGDRDVPPGYGGLQVDFLLIDVCDDLNSQNLQLPFRMLVSVFIRSPK
jgi:hypothetical protein